CWDYSVAQTRLFGWDPRSWEDQQALVALLALVAIATLAGTLWRRVPGAVFFMGFFFFAFLPPSHLIVFLYSVRAVSFLYLPCVGAAGCVAWAANAAATGFGRALSRGPARQPAWAAIMVYGLLSAAVVGLAVRAHGRNWDWQDEV